MQPAAVKNQVSGQGKGDLQDVIKSQPFKPFAVVFADGAKVNVPHPEWILFPRGAGTAVLMDPTDQRLHIIDVMLVQRLELDPPVPAGSVAPNPNGGE